MPPRRAKAAAAKKLTPTKSTRKAAQAAKVEPEEPEIEEKPELEEVEEAAEEIEAEDQDEEEHEAMDEEEEQDEYGEDEEMGDDEHMEEEEGEEDYDDGEHEDEEHEEEHVGSEEDEEYEVIDEDDAAGDDSSSPKKRKPVGESGVDPKRQKSDGEETEPQQNQESNMLGVRPLPEEITEEELKGIFDTALSVKLSRQVYSDGKRGYVEFKTVEEAKTVMESKQGAEFMGKKLELRFVYPQTDVRSRMYVGNLPWNGTESDLTTIFPTAKSVKIIKFKADKGLWVPIRYALLTFASDEEVKKLVEEKQNVQLKGHSLELMEENTQRLDYGLQEVLRHEVNKRTLVVQGLPQNATKDDLLKLFPEFIAWRIPRKHSSTRNQGVAELEFASVEEVTTAVEENQAVELQGSSLWLCSRDELIYGFKIGETTKLTVAGFPSETEVEVLKKAFDGVTNAVLKNTGTDSPLNSCAVIEFESPEAAKNAYTKKQGMKIRGRSVTLYNWGPITSRVKQFLQPMDKTKRLLLRNVPKNVTEETLAEHFPTAVKTVIITDYRTNESRGIAYVEYENREDAEQEAEKISEIDINGTKVLVEMVMKPREDLPLKYFVKNLPDTVTEDSLKAFFSGVEEVEIQGITVKSEKYGIIKFKTSDDAREALKNKSNLEIDGHKISLEYIKPDRTYRPSTRGRGRYNDRGTYKGRSRGRGFVSSRGSRGFSSRSRGEYRRGGYDSSRGGRGGYRGGRGGYESRESRGGYDRGGRGGRGRGRGGSYSSNRDYGDYRGRGEGGFRKDRDQYRDKEYREMEDYYKRREEYWRKDDYGNDDGYHRRDNYGGSGGRDSYSGGNYRQDYGNRHESRGGRDDMNSRDGYWGRDEGHYNRDSYDSRRQGQYESYSTSNRTSSSGGGFNSRGRDEGFRRDKFAGSQKRDDYGGYSGGRQNRFGDRESYSTRGGGGGRGSYRGGRGRGGGGFY